MNEQSITLPPGIDFREPGQLSPYDFRKPVIKMVARMNDAGLALHMHGSNIFSMRLESDDETR